MVTLKFCALCKAARPENLPVCGDCSNTYGIFEKLRFDEKLFRGRLAAADLPVSAKKKFLTGKNSQEILSHILFDLGDDLLGPSPRRVFTLTPLMESLGYINLVVHLEKTRADFIVSRGPILKHSVVKCNYSSNKQKFLDWCSHHFDRSVQSRNFLSFPEKDVDYVVSLLGKDFPGAYVYVYGRLVKETLTHKVRPLPVYPIEGELLTPRKLLIFNPQS